MSLTDAFLDYLKAERNKSDRTVTLYGDALADFKMFYEGLGEGWDWNTVTSDVVREWVVYLLDNKEMKASTVNLNLSALRTFYHYLKRLGKIKQNPMARVVGPKKDKALPVFVKDGDMDRLLDEEKFDDSFSGVLERTVLLTLYLTGMRRAELVGLEDKDIDFTSSQLKVTGKRNKQRLVPFGNELETSLREYIELRDETFPERTTKKLFVSKKGVAITAEKVYQIVHNNLSRVTTLQKRSPHVLRHSFATTMLNHDADLMSIQKLLGHANLQTTEVYTHLSFEELKKAYKDAHPRS